MGVGPTDVRWHAPTLSALVLTPRCSLLVLTPRCSLLAARAHASLLAARSPGGKWGVNRWKHDFGYLRRKAGHASVSVEYLDDTAATFGRGKRTTMRFGEFLSRLRTGRYYISSSQQHIGPHGFPDLMVSPLVELGKDLPSRLSWAGNLVPQQVNIWFGSSSSVDGVSSGLHHDYHDNFYVLLRGRKRFRLFPPSEVGRMQTYGEVLRVHENGRIVYKGQVGIGRRGWGYGGMGVWVWGYGKGMGSTCIFSSCMAQA